MRLYMALLHHPVYNIRRQEIASAITTLDLHDLARLACTYDVATCYVVTPLDDQRRLARRVIRHWTEGYGAQYNPDRRRAMERLQVLASLKRAQAQIRQQHGQRPLLLSTAARACSKHLLPYRDARALLAEERPVLVLFGTAWGLTESLIGEADYQLQPIRGQGTYNHLSVRAAAAIILDRLAGER